MFIYIDRETSAPDQKHFSPYHILSNPSQYWALPEKKITWINSKQLEFPEAIKKNDVKFLVILVSGLKISEEFKTIFWSFQGSTFLSGIFRAKAKTLRGSQPFWEIGMREYQKFFLVWCWSFPAWSNNQTKVENNWESTNNLKLWLLNISKDFLLCKIIASQLAARAVDTQCKRLSHLAESYFEE